MRLLLDEMYPFALAEALRAAGIGATTVAEQKLASASDAEVFGAAGEGGYVVLTENVADFSRIAADFSIAGRQHPGILIALSSSFSRRPAGIAPLVAAIMSALDQELADRVVFLQKVPDLGQ